VPSSHCSNIRGLIQLVALNNEVIGPAGIVYSTAPKTAKLPLSGFEPLFYSRIIFQNHREPPFRVGIELLDLISEFLNAYVVTSTRGQSLQLATDIGASAQH